jgi:hypothetical protein
VQDVCPVLDREGNCFRSLLVKPRARIGMEQVELKYDHPHGPRVRAALVPFYRSIANNLPFLVPIYRNIAHREVQPPFRRKFAVGELHQAIKREFGHRRGGVFFEAGANDGLLFLLRLEWATR